MTDNDNSNDKSSSDLINMSQQIDELEALKNEHRLIEEKLRLNVEIYRALFECAPISLWVEDFSDVKKYIDNLCIKGVDDFKSYFENNKEAVEHCAKLVKIINVNKYTVELFKASSKNEFFDRLHSFFTRESWDAFKENIIALAQGKTMYEVDTINQTSTGEKMHVVLRWSVCQGYEETLSKVLVSLTNITKRKEAEKALRIKDWALNSSINAIAFADLEGNLTYVNPSFLKLWGYDDEKDVLGKNAVSFWRMEEKAKEITDILRRKGMWSGELVARKKNGSITDVHLSASIVTDEADKPICMMASFLDISERRQMEETIIKLAYHDILTELPNRMLFNDRLTLELAHAQRKKQELSVMFLDLDYFKKINDTLGHSAGDKLLKIISERLKSLMRESDTIARIGGDEFMVLIPEITRVEDAVKIAEKILDIIKKPLFLEGRERIITTSIGIATYPHDGVDAETLMKNADIAMYQAKEKGRNNIQLYTPTMKDNTMESS